MKIYPSKKVSAARGLIALSMADIQNPPKLPTQKHLCKRSHRWVTHKYSRRCTRCGIEEEKCNVTGAWMPNVELKHGAKNQ